MTENVEMSSSTSSRDVGWSCFFCEDWLGSLLLNMKWDRVVVCAWLRGLMVFWSIWFLRIRNPAKAGKFIESNICSKHCGDACQESAIFTGRLNEGEPFFWGTKKKCVTVCPSRISHLLLEAIENKNKKRSFLKNQHTRARCNCKLHQHHKFGLQVQGLTKKT